MSKQQRIPSYRHHRASGQAVVTLGGKDHYLGKYDTEESRDNYNQRIAEWLANDRHAITADRLTVAELVERYLSHAKGYYVGPDGKPTSQLSTVRQSLYPLTALYGRTPADDFGPLALKAVRQQMVTDGFARTTINQRIDIIRRMFRWGVGNELVGGSVATALEAVDGLRKNRSGAKETQPVVAVADAYVDAIKPHVSATIWAMIQLQRLTGMRPGELVIMRGRDLDTSGKVWTYRPSHHKTDHHGHHRVVCLGPKAQEVLKPFLKPDLSAFIFSPAAAEAERLAERSAARKTPLSCGNRPGKTRKAKPARKPGDHYTRDTYRRAIERGCDAAFPPAGDLARQDGESERAWLERLTPEQHKALGQWRTDYRWHPHQLRHAYATELRRRGHSLDEIQVLLGHSHANVTQVYAERDIAKAASVAAMVG